MSTRQCLVLAIVLLVVFLATSVGYSKVELQMWDQPNVRLNEMMREKIEEWNKNNPEIQVTYTVIPGSGFEPWMKIGASLGSHEGPDICTSHIRVSDDWAFNGFLAPIPETVWSKDYIKENFPEFVSKWYLWDIEGDVSSIGKGDKGDYYLIPTGTQMAVLFYNVDLVKEGGIDPTQLEEGLTWDRLIEIAEKLTKRTGDGQLIQAGFSFEKHGWVWWDTILYSLGGHKYKPGPTKSGYVSNADSSESMQALQLEWDIFNKYKLFDPGFLNYLEGFGVGKVAISAGWGWIDRYMVDTYPNINYRGCVIPTFSGQPPYGMHRPAEWWVVPSAKSNPNYEKNKDATWKFFKEVLMSEDVLDLVEYYTGNISFYKPVVENPERMKKYQENSVLNAQLKMFPYTRFVGDEINEEFEAAIELEDNMLYNKIPPTEAVRSYIEKVNQILDERFRWITPEG